jgi:hypothetical protein
MNRFQKVLIFLISIIVIQSIAFSAVIIKAMIPKPIDDIQMVKDMPVPESRPYTVGILLDRVSSDPVLQAVLSTTSDEFYNSVKDSVPKLTWQQFTGDRGVTVVEVNGELQDAKLRTAMAKNLSENKDIPIDKIEDYTFRVQFIRNYSSETENFLSDILPSALFNRQGEYSYSVGFQTFGALKDQENQYHDVLSALVEYLAEAY